jgi:GT2 family glycosyltransferase
MNFTFGITTTYKNIDQLNEVFQSIEALNIPNYEILCIGPTKHEDTDTVKYIYFDESEKEGWITRKKNTLVQSAKYENVVLMHDYYVFDKDWYTNFLEFGNDWDVASCQQLLINGKRHFTDWVIWDSPFFPQYASLPYDDWSQTLCMYQSGGFMIVKKELATKIPFNEELVHHQAEDVEWSLRMRTQCKWVCNGKSIVRHNKVHRDAQ